MPVVAPRPEDNSALAMKARVGTALFGDEADPVKVGGYEILERLGAGAMGVVYAAWDKKLDRRVAVKLLSSERVSSDRERARLVREGKALAKISHPNVVHVYAVGEYGHDVFVVMELVDGVSLLMWQQEALRTTRELVEVYLQAGRGLAAAHRAGLVHRDFKPANVLVDKDGRVCVADFGLAQGPGLSAATTSVNGRRLEPQEQSPVTRTGALVGTPAYMAPEQLAGKEVDARADQFSFCVALYEALVGCRPFDVEALLGGAEHTVPRPTKGERRPSLLLGRALRRGLAIDPSQRFPDMDALLRAIDAHGIWRRRTWGLMGSVTLGFGVAWLAGRADSPVPIPTELVCETPDHGPAVEWNTRKAGISAAIAGTGKPFAAKTWESVDRTLGMHARQWSETYVRLCLAGDGPTSHAIESCLDRDAARFAAVLTALERVDGESIVNVDAVLGTLAPVESCLGVGAETGLDSMPGSEISDEVLASIEHARVIAAEGRDRQADEELTVLLSMPSEALDASSRTELQVLHGEVLTRRERYEQAWDVLTGAQAGADDDAHEARAILAQVELATHLERTQSAEDLSRQAAALIERLGRPSELHADLLDARGRLQVEQDSAAAVRLHQEALAQRARAAPASRKIINTKLLLANALAVDGQTVDARAQYEGVLASRERTLGKEHPDYASVLFDLGLLAGDVGEMEEARGWFEGALAIEQAALGSDSTLTARTEVKLAVTLFDLGEQDRARALAEHAWTIQRSKLPSGHSDRVAALRALATIELQLDHRDESLALHRLLVEETGSESWPDVLHNVAWLQCQVGDCAAARPFVDRARQQIEAILVGEHTAQDVMLHLYILHTSALVALAEGKLEEARALMTDVLRDARTLEGTEELVEEATRDLARIRRR